MVKRVRLARDGQLFAILDADDGTWLAGLLSAENRALYLSWWPGWEVAA